MRKALLDMSGCRGLEQSRSCGPWPVKGTVLPWVLSEVIFLIWKVIRERGK